MWFILIKGSRNTWVLRWFLLPYIISMLPDLEVQEILVNITVSYSSLWLKWINLRCLLKKHFSSRVQCFFIKLAPMNSWPVMRLTPLRIPNNPLPYHVFASLCSSQGKSSYMHIWTCIYLLLSTSHDLHGVDHECISPLLTNWVCPEHDNSFF